MAINSFLSSTPKFNIEAHQTQKKDNDKNMSMKKNKNKKVISPPSPPRPHVRDHQVISSWEQLKSILSCKAIAMASQVHDPSKEKPTVSISNYAKLRSPCGPSICVFRDVVHGNARVGHRSDTDRHSGSSSPGASRRHETAPLTRSSGGSCSSSRAGGMPLGRLSGCYECHAISIDSASRRYPRPRTLSACSECGEVFTKPESLELHQTIRHAVSELGPEDSGRHIVEIIFKSSWHRRTLPACKIERILKVRNSPRTVARFEEYRAAVKSRALNPKKHPRCAADGNELLRFHPAILSCALGSGSSLCSSPACGVCGTYGTGSRGERAG
ncbi:putative transcription factor C2H2 family [Dioscorea sansibarensis]